MFGNTKTTTIIDKEGSTKTAEKNIVAGDVKLPVRQHYAWKVRVHSQKEEHQAIISFSDELQKDKTMLDPSISWDFTKIGNANGYYYLVKHYTQLEY